MSSSVEQLRAVSPWVADHALEDGLVVTVSALPTRPSRNPPLHSRRDTLSTLVSGMFAGMHTTAPRLTTWLRSLSLQQHILLPEAIGGVGTTTTAELLAERVGLVGAMQGGKNMRTVAVRHGYEPAGPGFIDFLGQAERQPGIDHEVDQLVYDIILAERLIVVETKIWLLLMKRIQALYVSGQSHKLPFRYVRKLSSALHVVVDNENTEANQRLWYRQEKKHREHAPELSEWTPEIEEETEAQRVRRWIKDYLRYWLLYELDYRRQRFLNLANYKLTTDKPTDVLLDEFFGRLHDDVGQSFLGLIYRLADETVPSPLRPQIES